MKIVDIPIKMKKFYGSGKMLHPEIEMVEGLLQMIPYGKVALIDSLCEKMAYDHGTDVTCPMRTGVIIKKISAAGEHLIPFWRIIRNNHLLINSSSVEECAELLKEEGFEISKTHRGEFKVLKPEERLFYFL